MSIPANEDINIIGLGPATRKGPPGLYTLSIESFFPGTKSYFYTGVKPKTCVNFIDEIWKTENKNKHKIFKISCNLKIQILPLLTF